MKKSIPILLAVLLCLCTQTFAQNRADELMKQAQENLAKKEYIKARYLFLQAYNAFATQENYAQAVKCMGHRTKRFFQWSGKMGERF